MTQRMMSIPIEIGGTLRGKVAVITGSSRGLGYGIAELFAKEGASVVLSARSQRTLDEAVNALRAQGYAATGFVCDVGQLEQVQALAAHALETFGKIDIWINNAGVSGPYGPTELITPTDFERVVQTNILGTYYGSLVALHIFGGRGGKLINLLGRGDSKPVKYQNAYASSKAWVKSFTRALAQEHKAQKNLSIIALNPGLVDTDMLRKLDAVQGYERKLNPLKTVIRMWAKPPQHPAETALRLASSATDGKTGLVVSVLTPRVIISGALRELRQRLTGQARPVTLDITTHAPFTLQERAEPEHAQRS